MYIEPFFYSYLLKFKMEKNQILVATPNIFGDLYFRRTVVLQVGDSNNTIMGFILNKKMNYTLNEITPKIKKPFPLFYGGPLETDSLFFIYSSKVKVKESKAKIIMTLTTPNCPVAESLPKEVKDSAMQVEGIEEVDLDLVFEPPWEKSMMSEAAKLELNL